MQWDRLCAWSINDRLGGGKGLDLDVPNFEDIAQDAYDVAAAQDAEFPRVK